MWQAKYKQLFKNGEIWLRGHKNIINKLSVMIETNWDGMLKFCTGVYFAGRQVMFVNVYHTYTSPVPSNIRNF